MNLKIGDFVQVIDETLEGEILKIKNNVVQIKDQDDFLHEYQINQLVKIDQDLKIDENEIKSAVNKMHFIALSIIALMFILMVIGIEAGAIFFPIGLFTYSLFSFKPLGKAGELKQSVKEFVDRMKNFKVSSDKIIVENMIPQDKSLD